MKLLSGPGCAPGPALWITTQGYFGKFGTQLGTCKDFKCSFRRIRNCWCYDIVLRYGQMWFGFASGMSEAGLPAAKDQRSTVKAIMRLCHPDKCILPKENLNLKWCGERPNFELFGEWDFLQNCESEQGTGMNFTVNFYPGSTQQVRICFQDYFFLEPANHTQLRGCCSFSIYMCLAMRSLRDPTEANILMQSVLCRSWAPCFPSGDANTFLWVKEKRACILALLSLLSLSLLQVWSTKP